MKAIQLRKRRELIARLISDLKADLDALDRVITLVEREETLIDSASSGVANDTLPGIPPLDESQSFVSAVQDAVNGMEGHFDKNQLFTRLKELHPALSERVKPEIVSSVLWRLSKTNLVKVVVPGKGRRPSIYEKIKN